MNIFLILLILLNGAFQADIVRSESSLRTTTIIRGRVVVGSKPFNDAEIVVLPANGIEENLSSTYTTNKDGRFEIKCDRYKAVEDLMLYVLSSPLTDDFLDPIRPPFSFRGVTFSQLPPPRWVHLTGGILDLGDIPVQTWYRPLKIRIEDSQGSPLPDDFLNSRGRCFSLRIRNSTGDLVMQQIYNGPTKEQLGLFLPQGSWSVEIARNCEINDFRTSVFRAAEPPIVDGGNLPEGLITWRAPRLEKATEEPPKSEPLSASLATQRIKQLGFSLTTDAFVDRCRLENSIAVRLFLAAGFSPNAKDQKGETPLVQATLTGDMEIVNLLLAAGADPNEPESGADTGLTPLAAAASSLHIPLLERLVQAGSDPNGKSKDQWTALMILAEGHAPCSAVQLLLKAGAEVNARNSAGKTALSYALEGRRKCMIDLLRAAGGIE